MTRLGIFRDLFLISCLLTSHFAIAGDLVKLKTDTALHSVYFFPEENTNQVLVSATILAGEVDSTAPEGLSHYLEHLVFWHADQVDGKTLHARDGNAWVNGVVTNYFNSADVSEMNNMFRFAARVLQPPLLEKNYMLEERDIVIREYDLRVSENPVRKLFSDVSTTLYTGHPLSRSVIGTPDTIASLSIEQSLAFHAEFYHPSNMVLFVLGDTTESEVKRLVEKHFSGMPAGNRNQQLWHTAAIAGAQDASVRLKDPQASYDRLAYTSLSTWNGVENNLQDEYTLQILADILTSALPGSLSKPLRLDHFIVSNYELALHKLLASQVQLSILAVPDDGVALDTVNNELRQALTTLADEGVPLKTLERIKKRRVQTAKRESGDGEITFWRAQRHLSLGIEPTSAAEHIKRLSRVSKADVDSALKAIAKPERQVSGYVTPP